MSAADQLPVAVATPPLTLCEMQEYAGWLAKQLQSEDFITLRGEVGAGKTTFARALIQALSMEKVEITSPTFNLMQSYDIMLAQGKRETLWHLDLYRLDEPSEAEALGLSELEAHVVLVEWPEVIEHQLPPNRLDVTLRFSDDPQKRVLTFRASAPWQARLQTVAKLSKGTI